MSAIDLFQAAQHLAEWALQNQTVFEGRYCTFKTLYSCALIITLVTVNVLKF